MVLFIFSVFNGFKIYYYSKLVFELCINYIYISQPKENQDSQGEIHPKNMNLQIEELMNMTDSDEETD